MAYGTPLNKACMKQRQHKFAFYFLMQYNNIKCDLSYVVQTRTFTHSVVEMKQPH